MEIEAQPHSNPGLSVPVERNGYSCPLATLFIALFAQIILLILISFLVQAGPTFVSPAPLGFDFHDFHLGATDLRHHVDPYLRGRLFTPPSSILVGMVLQWASIQTASVIMLGANVLLILLSLRSLARQYSLNQTNEFLLYGIAFVFYPVYFLVERGNLDGIMLALLTAGFAARKPIVRAVFLGVSISIKVYSGLFLLVLLVKRRYKVVLVAVGVALLLQLPFFHLLPSFIHAILGRSGEWRKDENISPVSLIYLLMGGVTHGRQLMGRLVFYALWAGSLIYRLAGDDSEKEMSSRWTEFLPWVISFPTLVYAYSGVLALPLLARIAADCQGRRAYKAEKLVFFGFGLLGCQAIAWCANILELVSVPALSGLPVERMARSVHFICPLGTALMIVGACGLPKARRLRSE